MGLYLDSAALVKRLPIKVIFQTAERLVTLALTVLLEEPEANVCFGPVSCHLGWSRGVGYSHAFPDFVDDDLLGLHVQTVIPVKRCARLEKISEWAHSIRHTKGVAGLVHDAEPRSYVGDVLRGRD